MTMKTGSLFMRIHRILGSLLSILFLMWFLSGMVMMYHGYPSVTDGQRTQHSGRIMPSSVGADYPLPLVSDSAACSAISLERAGSVCLWRVASSDGERVVDASDGNEIHGLSAEQLSEAASRWSAAPPQLIDTLSQIDVWLIGAMPFKEYPIYHYGFADGRATELYLSSRTGQVLQLTDRESRFWAWVGAIPHWIYITKLRATGRQPWTDTVLWISGFGIAMVISGIIVGIRSMLLARKKRGGKAAVSPYKKPLFRWHHVAGLFFGLFVLTWIFSGFMSLADAPKLIWPVHGNHDARQVYAKTLNLNLFRLDCRRVLASDDVRRLAFMQMGDMPFYHVWTQDDDYLVDAADTLVRRVELSESMCLRIVKAVHHPQNAMAAMMTDYDDYYVSQKRKLPLPVCRVSVDDADKSVYYINPKDGSCRYYNTNKRAGKWMYSGLHALNTHFFAHHPLLRQIIMWVLLLGGTLVSVTGILLSFKNIRKKYRKKRAKKQ